MTTLRYSCCLACQLGSYPIEEPKRTSSPLSWQLEEQAVLAWQASIAPYCTMPWSTFFVRWFLTDPLIKDADAKWWDLIG